MDKVKPYTFWIVCGALLLIELVFVVGALFWPGLGEVQPPVWMNRPPSQDIAGWPKDMRNKVKAIQRELKGMEAPQDVADMFGDLYDGGGKVGKDRGPQGNRLGGIKLLEARAENLRSRNTYTREVDPSKEKDIEAFLSEYLVQEGWTGLLRSKIEDYQEKAARVEERLSDRSGVLEEAVSGKQEAGAWYTDYRRVTTEYLTTIIEGGVIEANQTEIDNLDTTRGLRERFALDSRERGYPEHGSKERDRLQNHYNLSRAILLPLLDVHGTVLADQHFVELREVGRLQAETPPRPRDTSDLTTVTVQRLKVEGSDREDGGKLAVWRVQLNMRGTAAALLEALRVLDGLEAPIIVRLGSSWKALDPADKKKVDQADGRMELTTKLAVCDFRAMAR